MLGTLIQAVLLTANVLPAQTEPTPGGPRAVLRPPQRIVVREVGKPVSLPAQLDPVLEWNDLALQLVRHDKTPPPMAARNLAIMHAAVFDAVNSVTRKHKAYLTEARTPVGTSAEAAAASAAHRVLVALHPGQKAALDAALRHSLVLMPAAGKADGVALGLLVADRMLASRSKDGSKKNLAYVLHEGKGAWRPTLPGYKYPLYPHWSTVTPFAIRTPKDFRLDPPPALTSRAYREAYDDVKDLGGRDSKKRTKDQTEIAYFWSDDAGTETPPGHWNRIARTVAAEKGLSLDENARLFALLNLSLADVAICCWDCKFDYSFWRPVHAIRDTEKGSDWTPLLVTPPFPTYTSGHSSFSGAGAAVLAYFFGTDRVAFSVTSDALPNVTRSFKSFSSAAREAGRSRIYGGIHWEFDNSEGLKGGRAVARYVVNNVLGARPREAVIVTPP
jgi:hypothetical protein